MSYLVICLVALLASALTFFSGFGLGTLLLPAFALFVPVGQAVALTAIVHFLNGAFKLVLVGRHASWPVVVRFGLPAIAAALAGAWLLAWLSKAPPLLAYTVLGVDAQVTPVKLGVGLLLLVFASLELSRRFRDLSFGRQYLPLGGLLSGFFGGLSGMQGALRSAFLVRAGLTKEGFIATGAVIATMIDAARLVVYSTAFTGAGASLDHGLLAAAVLAAFAGALLGNRYLQKVTLVAVQRLVAALLFLAGIGLVAGLL